MTGRKSASKAVVYRQPQVVQVITGKPDDHLSEIMNQLKPRLELAIDETTESLENFYTCSVLLSSGSPKFFVHLDRQNREECDMRGLNTQRHVPNTLARDAVDYALEEALRACQRWIRGIMARLEDEPDSCAIELVVMFRREVGEKTGRLYARKELLNAKCPRDSL